MIQRKVLKVNSPDMCRTMEENLSRNSSSVLSKSATKLTEENVTRHLCNGLSGSTAAPVKHFPVGNDFTSTVHNKLRRQRKHNWGDLDHVRARLSESLVYLAKTFKELTSEAIVWFQTTCFAHCLRYHGDPAGLERALLSIVDHAYGAHENCGDWYACNAAPTAHKPETFQPLLSDPRLQHKLNNLFRNLAEKSEDIAWGSTLAGTQNMSTTTTTFSFTLPSDVKKGLDWDNACAVSTRKPDPSLTRRALMSIPEGTQCKKSSIIVTREEEEEHSTGNNLTHSLGSSEDTRHGDVSRAEEGHVTRNHLMCLSGRGEYEPTYTALSREEDNVARIELTCLSDSAESRVVGREEEEPIHSNYLKVPSESATPLEALLQKYDNFTALETAQIRLKKKRPSNRSNLNHKQAHLGEYLGYLAKTYKELTPEVLVWFQTSCFTKCTQYWGDRTSLKRAFLSAVDHAYGDHLNCGELCVYNGDPQAHKPEPFQPILSDQTLKTQLNTLFIKLAEMKVVARNRSVKLMQSPNNVRLGKAHKTKYFVSPQPHRTRVKNAVYAYSFNESTNDRVPQEKSTTRHSVAQDQVRKPEHYEMQKNEKQKRESIQEKLKIAPCVSSGDGGGYPVDSKTPARMVKPSPELFVARQPMTLVFFDLETTSLSKYCEIVQLAAICGEKTFDRYILPVRGMSPGASRVTGLTVSGGVLRLHHRPLCVVPLKQALVEFVDWLKRWGQCLLVGHNSKSFDAPRLLLQLQKNRLAKVFCDGVLGFLDTLPYFRESKPNFANHRQETLATQLLKVKYNAHRALDDVKILQRLVKEFADPATLARHGFSATWAYESMKYDLQKQENLATFTVLENKQVLSRGMCEKAAGSGLRENDLRTAHACAVSRGYQGRDGIMNLLAERDAEGKIRVTNQAKVLNRIAAFYDEEMNSACDYSRN